MKISKATSALISWFYDTSSALRKLLAVILMAVLAVGIGYAVRTYTITQSLGTGFPGGSTSLWVVGTNSTLNGLRYTDTSSPVWPPQVGSNGTIGYENEGPSITCGG